MTQSRLSKGEKASKRQSDQIVFIFLFCRFSEGNNVFSNMSKPFFKPIKGKRFFRPYVSHLHGRHYSQARSSVPPKIVLFESWIRNCRFQIHLCIPACVISSEFTREVIMKFLPAQSSWIWYKSLHRNFIHSKIFQFDQILYEYFISWLLEGGVSFPSAQKVWRALRVY